MFRCWSHGFCGCYPQVRTIRQGRAAVMLHRSGPVAKT